jgi:DNA-binding MarR family transcriptional regulator/GNAT superfamily N-acetyltransferase
MTTGAVQEMRAFNRFYTNLIGALDYSRHLHTPFTLTEARVLYELVHSAQTDAADLRGALSVDAGQLSRILSRFEKQGLVRREPSARDGRRLSVQLTEEGREAAAQLERRSQRAVESLLARIPEAERDQLSGLLRRARSILGDESGEARAKPPRTALRAPRPGDLGWIVERNAAVYAHEFGWDDGYEALVARIVADFAAERDPRREAAWIAELDGRRAGCVMCVAGETAGTARLRLLLVDPGARGHGLGDLLVAECVAFARRAGYREVVLWTNDVLTSARRVYQRAGFELVKEEPHRSFGHDLVGQDWRLTL